MDTRTGARANEISRLLQDDDQVGRGQELAVAWVAEGTTEPLAWKLLAFAHNRAGDHEAVLWALDHRPDIPAREEDWAFELRIAALQSTGGFAAANRHAETVLRSRPGWTRARQVWIASSDLRAGPAAEVQALQLLALNNDDRFALWTMARIEFERCRWLEAIRYAERALAHGAPAVCWAYLGAAQLALNRERAADASFSRAIRSSPDAEQARDGVSRLMVCVLEATSRSAEAEGVARIFIDERGDDAWFLRAVARARWRADDYDEAVAVLDRALALDADEQADAQIRSIVAVDAGDQTDALRLVAIATANATEMSQRFPEVYVAWRLGHDGADELVRVYAEAVPNDLDLGRMLDDTSPSGSGG